jgi:integrase/recombinase XerD
MALTLARGRGDERPAFTVIAESLEQLGAALPEPRRGSADLTAARGEWLLRLQSSGRSASCVTAYRVALDDLLGYLARQGIAHQIPAEEAVVAYLDDYRRRRRPAEATYYRRFTLLRRFFGWLCRRSRAHDPFLELEPPPKPHQEADWLTPEEFQRMLAAAERPLKRRTGLAERDRLVLLTLVTTGLRRSELIVLDWADLDLEGATPSLLVRRGKRGRPRRQPLPRSLADELSRERIRRAGSATDPVFCGLGGRRLQPTILANIIRRTATRAGLEKHVTAHTLRHTAATWLRQDTHDARLVADFLGHADLSTVDRYAHIAADELHNGAGLLAERAGLG